MKLYMIHPRYPKMQIPAARVIGIGLHPAVPAVSLKPGDVVVMDYGKSYRFKSFSDVRPGKVRIHLFSRDGEQISRIVTPNTHIAVSWGTFSRRWQVPAQTGGKSMTKTGRISKLNTNSSINTGINMNKKMNSGLNVNKPIDSGVSFYGKVDLTKQGGVKGKKVDLSRY